MSVKRKQTVLLAAVILIAVVAIWGMLKTLNKGPVTSEANLAQQDSIQFLKNRKARLLQSLHKNTKKPYDPLAAAQLALAGFMQSSPSCSSGENCRPNFHGGLLPYAVRSHGQWDHGDCTGRSLIAWSALREITGDQEMGLEVEMAQKDYLLSLLHPETGLVFVPELSEPEKKAYYYHMWDQSRTLRALVHWYKTVPADRSRLKPFIERMIAGLDQLATVRGTDEKWGAYTGFTSDAYFDGLPVNDDNQWVQVRGGLSVEPLVQWVEITGDAAALNLARLFSNAALATNKVGISGNTTEADIKPDGSFDGHLHSKTATLIGMARLGSYLLKKGRQDIGISYLQAARKSYDWLFGPECGANRMGWIPERPGTPHSETCCAADVMELAEILASCADLTPSFKNWTDFYDDLERMAVNVPARTQIRLTPEWEAFLAANYGDDAEKGLETARKFNGTWSATFFPNDLTRSDGLILGGCCQYSGVTTLYTGWKNAMQWSDQDQVLQVKYFMKRSMPQAEMTTALPVSGEARIVLKENATVMIRVPSLFLAEDMRIKLDGRLFSAMDRLDATGRFVVIKDCSAGAVLDIEFPLEKRTTIESMGGKESTVDWLRNYVMHMSHEGENLPFFP